MKIEAYTHPCHVYRRCKRTWLARVPSWRAVATWAIFFNIGSGGDGMEPAVAAWARGQRSRVIGSMVDCGVEAGIGQCETSMNSSGLIARVGENAPTS